MMLKLTQLYIFAQSLLGSPDDLNIPTNNVNTQFSSIVNTVSAVAAVVAVVVIIVAGIQMSSANGNPQTVSKAKNAILFSVIGLIIVASAFTIINFVLGRF